jgi:ubiquinone/menaquinone biosynthesis C-methylase UbiE
MEEETLRQTIETYDHIAPYYVQRTQDKCPQKEFEAFCQNVASQGTILDAGCAGGRDCQSFAQRGFSVIGIDLSAKLLKIAKDSAPTCRFLQADIRNIPLPDSSVDGVWSCASILHLERAQVPRALAEFNRVLKTGAACCIIVKKGQGRAEETIADSTSQGMPRFFTYFQEDELRGLCRTAGFTVLKEHTTNERDEPGPSQRDQDWIFLLLRKDADESIFQRFRALLRALRNSLFNNAVSCWQRKNT